MYLYPAIDLRDGQVVRLTQGLYDQQTTYDLSPVEQAASFADGGATRLHIVDLDGARTGKLTQMPIIKQICQLGTLAVQVGGGVRTENTIDRLFNAGVKRVILGTAALKNWTWFEGLMTNPTYRGKLILGLDAKEGQLAVSGWEEQLECTALDIAKRISQWPVAGIIYTDIATDGMMKGPNLAATEQIAKSTDVPVIASGGVSCLDDLQALSKLPIAGAIVGKALYEKAFDLKEAIEVFQ